MSFVTATVDTVWVFLLAAIYALMEIEMEGKHGWAKHLPTTKNILGQFTLYHVYMLLFLALLFSGWFGTRFVAGCSSGWTVVFHFAFYFLLWLLVEDFLWFVFNPHYTLDRYRKDVIPWHKIWVGDRVPAHNVGGLVVLALLAVGAAGNGELWLSLGISGVMLLACVFVAPAYHKFYVRTHQPYM